MNLHKKTMLEVQALLDETGHALDLSDFSDIVELDELANRVTGAAGDYAELYSWPVKCGNLVLRPFSLGKLAWYNDRAVKWFEDDAQTSATVMAFLLSVENDEQFLWNLDSPERARETIEAWERDVCATPIEIAAAVDKVMSVNQASHGGDDGDKQNDHGPLVALLCREYGNTPGHWMYECGINIIHAMVNDHVHRMNAEISARNRANSKSRAPPIKTPSMDATLKFQQKMAALKTRWTSGG